MHVAAPEQGSVAKDLARDFPELSILHLTVQARSGPSTESVRRRLRWLANRMTGGHVVHMRQDPVPSAYRAFWRQVGIDPDTDRTPAERIAFERLRWGGLSSRNLLDDAITIATLETGVPVTVFDADRVGVRLGLRTARSAERLGGSGRSLPDGQVVIGDDRHSLAVLGGEIAEERGVTLSTRRMVVAAVGVKGVPRMGLEEALWTVIDTLQAGG